MAFRDNYQPSAVVTAGLLRDQLIPNTISFGFASGEASSDFIGSPGQIFYAPVTLNPLSDTQDLQPPVQFDGHTNRTSCWEPRSGRYPGSLPFESFLEKPDLKNPGYFISIPPAMFLTSVTNPPPSPPPG